MLMTDAPAKSQPNGVPSGNTQASLSSQFNSQSDFSSDTIRTTINQIGGRGLKENLEGFNRISGVSLLIILTSIFLGLSTYSLWKVELSDQEWMRILKGKFPFPNLSTSSTHNRTRSYFEAKFIKDIPVGLMLKSRERWTPGGVDFGLARETAYHLVLVGVIFVFAVISVLHLLCLCTFKRCRRQFLAISIMYGALGLFMFILFLGNLHYGFVHKTSAYLENARVPPAVPPTGDNETKGLFINLTLACAFAYSTPNYFVNYTLITSKVPVDGSFVVDGFKYRRRDLMDLNLCPRQDQFLIALIFLFLTGFLGWLVSAVTEILEHQIVGPPAWLQRFKVTISKGVRHWKSRAALPTYLELSNKFRHDKATRNLTIAEMRKMVDDELGAQDWYRNQDPYAILDGKQNHVQLRIAAPWLSFSRNRFYPSNTNLALLTAKKDG